MPYFAWKGVNLRAQICNGVQFARNKSDLDALLIKKDIALLSLKQKKIWWNKPISLQEKIDYFMQLNILIKAGMLLPDALNLIAAQMPNSRFAAVAYQVADQVQEGHLLSQGLASAQNVFDPLMIQMANVGQESGSLTASLQVLTNHLESLASFRARLKGALMLPLITFCFFLVVISIMLMVIVPQFASLFASMHRELPGATKMMIGISNFLKSGYFVLIGLLCAVTLFLIRFYAKTAKGKKFFDDLLMRLPLSRYLVINKNMAGFFQSIALLMRGGMPLVKAVMIAKESISNSVIKKQMENLADEINAGSSFAESIGGYSMLIGQEMISLIKVGQESGMLADMLVRVSDMYQQRLLNGLSRINTLFQPFLLIILGLMITGLILALYTPIMSLSYAI